MSLAAQRFKFLDAETNVPVANFVTNASSDILNGPMHDLVTITDQLLAVVDGNKSGSVDKLLKTVMSGGLGTSRITKDYYSTISDLSRVSTTAIGAITKRMFPGSTVVQNAFNQIGEGCKNKLLAGLSNCRNKKNVAKHNGKFRYTNNRSCSADSFINLINKITNGAYNLLHVDQCALSKMVAGVAIRGFEIGLPAVFSALSTQITDKHLLAQTGNMVIGASALDGNMDAVQDVADSTIGPLIYAQNPNISSSILSNFKLPGEVQNRDVSGYYDSFAGSMDRLDSGWMLSSYKGAAVPSLENMADSTDDLSTLYECKANNEVPSFTDSLGNVGKPTSEQLIAMGLKSERKDPFTSLLESNNDIPLFANKSSSSDLDFTDYI